MIEPSKWPPESNQHIVGMSVTFEYAGPGIGSRAHVAPHEHIRKLYARKGKWRARWAIMKKAWLAMRFMESICGVVHKKLEDETCR